MILLIIFANLGLLEIILNIEIIENIIFHSFVVDGFKDYKNYLLCGNNSIDQVYNLINYFKIIN